jgi:hypothetical protein
LKEERRVRVFENSLLKRIFGPKRDEVTLEWRKLHNEELNDLFCSPNIVRVIKFSNITKLLRCVGFILLFQNTSLFYQK